jgi:hypothetical protein
MCDSTETPGSAPALAKFGLHLPLNRQSAVAREGIDLDVSPLAYWAGAAAVPLIPLVEAIRARAHPCRHNRAGGQREV